MDDRQVARVEIVSSDESTASCELHYTTVPPYSIRLAFEPLSDKNYVDQDLFECLVQLRHDLEARGLRILVQGSRVDAFPSGMSRDMSGGKKLYVLRTGQVAAREDAVDIFDPAARSMIGTVAEQRANSQNWLSSRGISLDTADSVSPQEVMTNRQVYNLVSDVAVGLNVRKRDNLVQAVAILVAMVLGAIIGAVVIKDHLPGALVGGFAGIIVGLLSSGIALMIYRFIAHVRGRHD